MSTVPDAFDPSADWELPLDDVDLDKMGGFDDPLPGKYHSQVNFIDPDDPKTGKMVVDVEILAGLPAGQEGLVKRIFFNVPSAATSDGGRKAAASKRLTFAIATGLTTKAELKALKEAHQPFRPNWQLASKRQLVVEIEHWESNGKSGNSVEFNMWALDDPKAAGVPINQGMLSAAGDAAADDPFDGGI